MEDYNAATTLEEKDALVRDAFASKEELAAGFAPGKVKRGKL